MHAICLIIGFVALGAASAMVVFPLNEERDVDWPHGVIQTA
jgi:hypothetical protein